ncbi:hypothetical protein DFH06DRAFT_1198433 [Mycena polygramma]|nr:hypothetical protein DFH06DRAFT_1198433 [Mycena polygramma]
MRRARGRPTAPHPREAAVILPLSSPRGHAPPSRRKPCTTPRRRTSPSAPRHYWHPPVRSGSARTNAASTDWSLTRRSRVYRIAVTQPQHQRITQRFWLSVLRLSQQQLALTTGPTFTSQRRGLASVLSLRRDSRCRPQTQRARPTGHSHGHGSGTAIRLGDGAGGGEAELCQRGRMSCSLSQYARRLPCRLRRVRWEDLRGRRA